MSESPILLPEAKADIANAYRWYEEQAPGLGLEFLRCVETALLAMQRTPLSYPVVLEAYRRSLVRKFPYALFFEFIPDRKRCVVYAVFHCSQNPDKWQSRLPS